MIDFIHLKNTKTFSKMLPADVSEVNIPRQVVNAGFSFVNPKKTKAAEWVHKNSVLMNELGIDFKSDQEALQILSGNKSFSDFKSYAMCYGGHQFGHWAGQLGDGRAINIAEIDLNNQNWKLQLKGAGPTPYSRTADGLAVLRSSIREYLCSEAMFHLNVPTTRALSIVKTGNMVTRDMLYDGNPKEEIGAVVSRMAPSFIRFGNFEIFAAREDLENLRHLADYTIKSHFTNIKTTGKEKYLAFFSQVASKTKEMMLHWQRVGFVHGVMNTDNMSILGLTIDYGPYGWLENYDPGWTPNTTDRQHKRYRFGNQPNIALWNLTRLANALYPLVNEVDPLEKILLEFRDEFQIEYTQMMLEKLGLYQMNEVDENFVPDLNALMEKSSLDFTIFFREFSTIKELNFELYWESIVKSSYLEENELVKQSKAWQKWLDKYFLCLKNESIAIVKRQKNMQAINPKYVLRNYMAQIAIDAAEENDYSVLNELFELLKNPYEEQPEMKKWYSKRPEWANHKVGCAMLSCSS
ncbi:YdiU family protein [Putridiphycobacter roseus]|uniref:Protein nucleotidyltransferase YdiU n=1 Tax=Putridiphycobacter roseus TaxID=2219161 RepID=A0A2W1N2J4_9FLAO|nr:YdiU family protein [Putridiphycobacter roseus]PZE17750.1 YdiU family protein [Putridiphycobacter roseus]